MATAFVTGTVALMLEANPDLNSNLVRLILLLSAIKLEQPHMLEQGNGLVNALPAVQLAEVVDMDAHQIGDGVSPQWDLDGETVWAGGGLCLWQSDGLQPAGGCRRQPVLGERDLLGGWDLLGGRHFLG